MARPRSFDPTNTLMQLKEVFWTKGFDGTSMSDIELATGLNKQSLYRIWGDKRRMYLAALDAYAKEELAAGAKVLVGPGEPRDKFETLFFDAAKEADPRGCFLCNASIDQAQHDEATRKAVEIMIRGSLDAFKKALGPGKAKEAAALQASYQGLRVMAAAGLPRNLLMQVARGALAQLD